jgi:hypothetical protein
MPDLVLAEGQIQDQPIIETLTLLDADTGASLSGFDPIAAGAEIDLAKLPTSRLDLRATPRLPHVGSVGLSIDGQAPSIDNAEPYTFRAGATDAWVPTVGPHSLTATAYSGPDGTDAIGRALSISLTVVDNRSLPTLSRLGGDGQSGVVASALMPFVVAVHDSSGQPVPNATVTFAVTMGGGSVSTDSILSDATGRALTILTLGRAPGMNEVTVTARGVAAPVIFTAVATVGAPSRLISVSGDFQTAVVRSALSIPLQVRLADGFDNPVAGAQVGFTVVSGGGSLTAPMGTTDASGQTSVLLTLGPQPGANTVQASVSGLSPVLFTATAVAAPATQLVLVSGDNQTVVAGQTANPFVVSAKDAAGFPVAGQAVTFSVASGAGSLSASSVMTDAAGLAQVTLTLATNVGPNTVTATSSPLTGSPITFTAMGIAGPAAALALFSGNNQSGVAGLAVNPFVVAVQDVNGNAVPGQTVSFAVSAGNGTLSAPSAVTDANGRAQTTLTLGSSAGANTVIASIPGLSGSPVTFTATGNAGGAARLTLVSGNNQQGIAGAVLPPLVVAVSDAAGNPVSGVSVGFAVSGGGGSLSSASSPTDASGKAQTVLTLGKTAGANTVVASVAGLTGSPLTFTATGAAGAATQLTLVSGNNQTGTLGATLNPFVVAVTDANGNGVAGKTVSFAVAAGGGSLSAASGTTDSTGKTQAVLKLGTAVGANTVTASAAGLTGSPLTFTATANPGTATKVAMVSGDGQTAVAGSALSPFVVSVTDASGLPVPGFTIGFAVTAGGGTLSSAQAVTNSSGQAQSALTLGKTAGTNTVQATVSGLQGSPVTFTATGTAGAATQLVLVSGAGQAGPVRTPLPAPLVVAVRDVNNNPVSGVTVAFAVTQGGGSLSAATVATPSNGQAQTMLTLGSTAGANTVTASVSGLTGSPVTFSATATAGAASQLTLMSGNNQTAGAGATLSPFVVAVKDTGGNPVSGFTVTFAVASGGGTLSVASASTNSSGQAQSVLTLGKTAGVNTVTASAAGLAGSPLTFTANGTAGPATQLVLVSGNNQSAAVASVLPAPLVVVARDANSNPVAGVTVTFAMTAGAGTLSATSGTTGSNGQAQTQLTLGHTPGPNTVTASVSGLAGSPLTFTATATVGAPSALTMVSGNNQTAIAGATVAPLVVAVKDAVGNPVPGFTVIFAVTGGGGTLSSTAAVTNAAGQGQTQLTLGKTAGTNTVTVTASGLAGSPMSFSAVGTAGPPSRLVIASGDGQSARINSALPNPLVVTAQDANGNGVSGVSVSFAVGSGGGVLTSASPTTTDTQGRAQTTFTLGAAPGPNTVIATAAAVTGAQVTLTETATAITFTTDIQPILNTQCIVCHSPGNPAQFTPLTSFALVRFGVSFFTGGPIVVPGDPSSSQIVMKTQATGTMYVNLGPDNATRDANGKLISDWIAQGAFNTAVGPATQLTVASGNNQVGTKGALLPAPLVVYVLDANMNQVSNFSVTFAIAAGDGTLSATTVKTDALGRASTQYTFGPSGGTQTITATATGLTGSPVTFTASETTGTGTVPAQPLAFSCDPTAVAAELPLPRLTRSQLQNSLQFAIRLALPADATAIWNAVAADFARFPAEVRTPAPGDLRGGYDRVDQTIQQTQIDAMYTIGTDVGAQMTATSARMGTMLGACATDTNTANDRTCLEAFVGSWGSRVLRYPLTAADVTYYADMAGTTPVDPGAVADVIAAMLNAPEVLYRVEHGTDDTLQTAPLSAYELAARLSLHYWDAPPDDALWTAAQNGTLLSATTLSAQVDRLIQSPNFASSLNEFVAQWLRLEELPPLDTLNTDPVYQAFVGMPLPSSTSRNAMIDDVLASARAVIASSGTPSDFLNDKHSYAQDTFLAGIYQVSAWSGSGAAPLFSSMNRSGLLTRAALLSTGTAGTRPIHKGYVIRNAILCQQLGPPPNNVMLVPPTSSSTQTTRQAVTALTAGGTCTTCHTTLINPLGFLSEGFDALGRERTLERVFDAQGNLIASLPVDTSAVPGVVTGDTTQMSSVVDVTRYIDATKLFHSCLARQYFRFSQSRVEAPATDGCALSTLETTARSGASLSQLFKTITTVPSFTTKRFF